MLFFTLTGANIDFLDRKLRWRIYTTEKTFLTTRHVKLVGKKEFVAIALDPEYEIFVIHVASIIFIALPSSSLYNVHLFRRSQIANLIAEKASTKISAKYLDIADIFLPDLASKLFKHTKINNHAIELVDSQQPPYGPIYSLKPVKLETLKTYCNAVTLG